MAKSDWDIPRDLQPDPEDWDFDLDRALNAVVRIHAIVPDDAFTAHSLGTERDGSGVVIQESGLIVTIGYLVTEAETIWIYTNDGRAIPGHALAVDQESGFALVQALGRLELPALEIGDSGLMRVGSRGILAASGGRGGAVVNQLASRHDFAGYWEYALDEAFYTAPAHPHWGGTAYIGEDGRLMGIGSLVLQQGGDDDTQRPDMNMVVPIALLPPILADLTTYGRRSTPPRPWLGIFLTETSDAVVVGGIADGGPAEKAGVEVGDRIVAVSGDPVEELGEVWRRVWATGAAGVDVPLRLAREGRVFDVVVASSDRMRLLKAPQLH